MFLRDLVNIWYPERYHGWAKKRKFFEGWYYKLVNLKEDVAIAVIPGIAMDDKGEKQSFIQMLNGKTNESSYHRFDATDFKAAENAFDISISENRFTLNQIKLTLPDIHGELSFHNPVPWPKTWHSPGIMGWYSFVPFMECYHGIISMNHSIQGRLQINDRYVDFTGGRGYMEKDWGESFPSSWIWMQTNHFEEEGISFKASIARIPWLTGAFIGFISGIWLKDHLIRFTTYTGAALEKVAVNENQIDIVLSDKSLRLEITAHRSDTGELASPILGMMNGRVKESMTSAVDIHLTEKMSGKRIYEGTGRNAGLEVAGNYKELLLKTDSQHRK